MKPLQTLPSNRSLLHEQIAHKLNSAWSISNQVTTKLALVQQRNRLIQQQVRESEARIDQLLTTLKLPNYPVASATNEHSVQRSVKRKKQLTEVDQLLLQLQQRSELLRQSAHDLTSNFSLIRGAADLLKEARTDEERQQMMDMLQRNVQHATQLLTQLLDITRLEAGEERRQLTTFNVADLLSSLVETIQPVANEKNLWLRKQGVSSLLIEGDWVKLQRVAQNLLLNAVKYTQVGGVTLSWKTGGAKQRWCLMVTDTGPGLSTANQQASGEGIGLLIVKQLCDLLEGQLSMAKPKKGGTRFVLSFPRRYTNPSTSANGKGKLH